MTEDSKRPASQPSQASSHAESSRSEAPNQGASQERQGSTQSDVTPPGELLRNAREAARLSEQDVARELRMTVTKVRYLEADEYDKLHSDTFVRGYLRTYAKLLDLEPQDLLDAYHATRKAQGWDAQQSENPIQVNIAPPSKPLWRFAIWIVILLVGLWALSVWFLGNRQEASAEASLVDPMAEMTAMRGAQQSSAPGQGTAIDAQGAETPQTNSAQPSGDLEGDEPSEQVAQLQQEQRGAQRGGQDREIVADDEVEALASTGVSVGEAQYSSPELLDRLHMEFSEECWVEVVDARGDVLQTNLLQPGRALSLLGEAPFEVKLGNAGAATLTLNDEPFDFTVPPGGRLVTLTVD